MEGDKKVIEGGRVRSNISVIGRERGEAVCREAVWVTDKRQTVRCAARGSVRLIYVDGDFWAICKNTKQNRSYLYAYDTRLTIYSRGVLLEIGS